MEERSERQSSLRFLAEDVAAVAAPGASDVYREIVIPEGASMFDAFGNFAPVASDSEIPEGALLFEALRVDGRLSFLMIAPAGTDARVNGLAPPRVGLLEIRDQLVLAGETFHLSRFRSVQPGPPPPEAVGLACGVCMVKISATTRVLIHDCGAPLHLEDDSVPEKDRLLCGALGGACPTCAEPVVLEDGYVYTPELPV